MATITPSQKVNTDIEPYRLHVSQRWLDLTRQKLELARIPRDPPGTQPSTKNDRGFLKEELVSLLDYWQETYDHRALEEEYNNRLPQFRTNLALTGSTEDTFEVKVPNIHFVHRKSSSVNAIPLLFCHDWGGSFVEVARVLEGLCEPISTPTPTRPSTQAFHVVCPSIPGFGFSDASPDPDFGLEGTADILDALMQKLGYKRYMLHGSKWGFLVCRTIALRHAPSCIAMHTAGVQVPRPTFRYSPLAWLSYNLARLTGARYPLLSSGYVPSDFEKEHLVDYHSPTEALSVRSGTLDYALADSPAGLLALMLDVIRSGSLRSISSSSAVPAISVYSPWTPAEIVFWTMLYWLPGPEAPLRWLRNSAQRSRDTSPLWRTFSSVVLGVSHFQDGSPPAWCAAYQRLSWVRRHNREVHRPAWEAPEDLIMDIRSFAGECEAVAW